MFLYHCLPRGEWWVSAAVSSLARGRGRPLLSESLLPGTLREAHSRLFQGILSDADSFREGIGCLAPSHSHLLLWLPLGALGPHLQTQTSPSPLRGGTFTGSSASLPPPTDLAPTSYSGSQNSTFYCSCGYTPTLSHHFMNAVPGQPPFVSLFLLSFFRPQEVCP